MSVSRRRFSTPLLGGASLPLAISVIADGAPPRSRNFAPSAEGLGDTLAELRIDRSV